MGLREKMVKQVTEMANWAYNYIPVELNSNILDIGCGGGKNLQNFAKLASNGKVYGIDYSEVSVKISKKVNKKNISSGLVDISHGSVSKLPYEDNKFDIITGFECHFFWPNIIEDLKEVKRVLKPDGTLYLIAETFLSENKEHVKEVKQWSEMGDFPVYSPTELEVFFQKTNFPVYSTTELEDFFLKAGYSDIEIILENDANWLLIRGKK